MSVKLIKPISPRNKALGSTSWDAVAKFSPPLHHIRDKTFGHWGLATRTG